MRLRVAYRLLPLLLTSYRAGGGTNVLPCFALRRNLILPNIFAEAEINRLRENPREIRLSSFNSGAGILSALRFTCQPYNVIAVRPVHDGILPGVFDES